MIDAVRRTPLVGLFVVLTLVAAFALPDTARAQGVPVAGQNVNMVSGTGWPGGDPFLQRQNEPSIAVSTRNPAHLLAGANDYRTVDIPGLEGNEVGDAWLGVFKSFDGGQTWQSTLLPGYPQDNSAAGTGSPLKGFKAAADPVLRAGTDGLLYYGGITLNRDTNLGQVFVSRFIDQNDREGGNATATTPTDPIRYVDTVVLDTGTSGQFLDKEWLAVDIPRAGAKTCTISGQPAGNVYMAYAKFTGSNTQNSQVLFLRSTDCGKTWTKPMKISPNDHKNQGTSVAIDAATGAIYVAYRRFETNSNNPDAIVVTKSTDFGKTFNPGVDAALVEPFDQNPTTATRFRTSSLPAIAVSVDTSGTSRVHVAWAQRDAPDADARVVVKTSLDGVSWPSAPVKVDDVPLSDDFCQGCFAEGHQFMPSLTFTEGRLMVLYYDQRLDQTLGRSFPLEPFFAYDGSLVSDPPPMGSFFREERDQTYRDLANFGPTIDDLGLPRLRHLLDVRVAEADPANMAFTSSQVSRYKYGTLPGTATEQNPADLDLDQLEVNPPNVPMFSKGKLPFIGDYIEIAGLTFVPKPGGGWQFNAGRTKAPVHYAVWTSNQDVVPPPDGDWTKYTPPTLPVELFNQLGPNSVFDGTPRGTCTTDTSGFSWAGTRNQNIYFSRITEGLGVWSPQNAKPLNVDRAFVVIVQNATLLKKTVLLGLPDQTSVPASFERTKPETTRIWVEIPPLSSIARAVFAKQTPNIGASFKVTVDEVAGACTDTPTGPVCPPLADGAATALLLNAPGSFAGNQPSIVDADTGAAIGSEVYLPTLSSAAVTSPNLAAVTSAAVTSAAVTSAAVTSAAVTSQALASPQLAAVTSAAVTSAAVTSYNLSDAAVTSAAVTSAAVTSAAVTSAAVTSGNILAAVTSAPLSDANYALKNTGNTTHSYHVKLVGTVPLCPTDETGGTGPCPVQLILSKPYSSPYAVGCTLAQDFRPVAVVNVDNVTPAVVTDPSQVTDPEIPDPNTTNATITLGPGETGIVTIRGPLELAGMQGLAQTVVPVVVPHAGTAYVSGLLIVSDGSGFPALLVGQPFTATMQAIGVSGTPVWSAAGLPTGLSIDPATGVVSGTPTATGTFDPVFTLTADGETATKTLSFTVGAGPTATTLSASAGSVVYGTPVTITATVSASVPATGVPSPAGSVEFAEGGATIVKAVTPVSGGVSRAQLGPTVLAVGPHTFSATFQSSDTNYSGSNGSNTVTVSVTQLTPTITVSGGGTFVYNTLPRVATATVTGLNGALLTSADGSLVITYNGSVTAPATVGSYAVLATFTSTNPAYTGATGTATIVINKANTTATLSAAPTTAGVGQSVTLTATVAVVSPGAGAPTGSVTFRDGSTVLGTIGLAGNTATLAVASLTAGSHSLTATYNGDGNFNASAASSAVSVTVKAPYQFTGFDTPLTTAGTLTSPTLSGSWSYSRVLPIKWMLKDSTGKNVTSLSSTKVLAAWFSGATCTAAATPPPMPDPIVPGSLPAGLVILYSPTSGAAGGSTFRSSSSGFTFNWDATKGSKGAGCYWIRLQLDDMSPEKVTKVLLN